VQSIIFDRCVAGFCRGAKVEYLALARLWRRQAVSDLAEGLGPYPLSARAACKVRDEVEGEFNALRKHFKAVKLEVFVVGTGVDHAFAKGGSMPQHPGACALA
jgi:hypothetical protein